MSQAAVVVDTVGQQLTGAATLHVEEALVGRGHQVGGARRSGVGTVPTRLGTPLALNM